MVTIKLEVQQVDMILGALAEQPFKVVADLIINIRGQALAQLNPPPAPAEDPPPTVEG